MSNDWIESFLARAVEISILCNQGQTVKAGLELVALLDVLISHYGDLNTNQQLEIKDLIMALQLCQNNKDFYSIADYLQFELPYILQHV